VAQLPRSGDTWRDDWAGRFIVTCMFDTREAWIYRCQGMVCESGVEGTRQGASDPEITSAEDRNPGQARSRPG
jgi:hypothetical protein